MTTLPVDNFVAGVLYLLAYLLYFCCLLTTWPTLRPPIPLVGFYERLFMGVNEYVYVMYVFICKGVDSKGYYPS